MQLKGLDDSFVPFAIKANFCSFIVYHIPKKYLAPFLFLIYLTASRQQELIWLD